MSTAVSLTPIEAVLYRKLTFTDWTAIHGKRTQAGGGGERHIALETMQAGSSTSRFLQTTTSPFQANFVAVGSLQSEPLQFVVWASEDRRMWRVPDQYRHRHPAISLTNGFPAYDDPRLWNSAIQTQANWIDRVTRGDWLKHVVVYWVRCPGPTFFMGFVIGDELPPGWPRVFQQMFISAKKKETGIIEVKHMSSLSPLAQQVIRAIEDGHRNILMYGPPGSGKTVAMQEVKAFMEDAGSAKNVALDPADPKQPFQPAAIRNPIPEPVYTDWITFHQSMSYEEFVVGLRPVPAKGGVALQPRAGRLLEAVKAVKTDCKSAVLFIDEFNRGNPAQVFGEMITFLEADKRRQPIRLLGVNSNGKLKTEKIQFIDGVAQLDYPLPIPEHLYIVASVNSLDRSVAPLDQALARRFHRISCPPDMEFLRVKLGLAQTVEQIAATDKAPPDGDKAGLTAAALLSRINKYIRHLLGPDFEFGHGYLNKVWEAPEGADRWRELAVAWDAAIFPQLEEMFRTRNNELARILRVSEADAANFDAYPYKLERPPSNLEDQELRVVYPASAVQSVNSDEDRRKVLAFLASAS